MSFKSSKGRKSVKDDVDFPTDWPIDANDPSQEGFVEQQTLAPGPLLHACSGADVFIAKSASQKKSTQQNYLCLLPGNLQLEATIKKTGPPSSQLLHQNDDEPESDKEQDGDHDNGETKPGSEKNKSKSTVIGSMENFSSSPVLSLAVALGQSQGQQPTNLQFQGQHVTSTSKFLLLSFQPKKKNQRVTVKQVYYSVVAFGNGSLVGPDVNVKAATAVDACVSHDTGLDHYGGSSRCNNAGLTGKSPMAVAKKVLSHRTALAIAETDSEGDESSMDDLDDSPSASATPRRTSLSRQSKSNRKNLAETEAGDDDEIDDDSSSSSDEKSNHSDNHDEEDVSGVSEARCERALKKPNSAPLLAKGFIKPASAVNSNRKMRAPSDSSDASAIELSSYSDDDSSDRFSARKKRKYSVTKNRKFARTTMQPTASAPNDKKVRIGNASSSTQVPARPSGDLGSAASRSVSVGRPPKKESTSSDSSDLDSDGARNFSAVPNNPRQPISNRLADNTRRAIDASDIQIPDSDDSSVMVLDSKIRSVVAGKFQLNSDESDSLPRKRIGKRQRHNNNDRYGPDSSAEEQQQHEEKNADTRQRRGKDEQSFLADLGSLAGGVDQKPKAKTSTPAAKRPSSLSSGKDQLQHGRSVLESLAEPVSMGRLSVSGESTTPTRASPSLASPASSQKRRRRGGSTQKARTLAAFVAANAKTGFAFLPSEE